MAPSETSTPIRSESPDPASHAANIYDISSNEGEWLDETDDDDMDFEPTTDESEDVEFFDPAEDHDADFHGTCVYCSSIADLRALRRLRYRSCLLTAVYLLAQTPRKA